ncbi:Hachiman antiphage defense system protein HamA [Caldalkalibacillus mannanilyticus]|uniref:Hachiman antiphage defense system protein HamA n=1 Tax=Caldalkalibacillus mannanilyticus TaxID=1418 RepID=UPI00046A8BD8|nr:Hachiman antiphage defense system protein HamA [Caldalkalibacillus mannanilyticus]
MCGVQGTAFFIDESHAITAKHCVDNKIMNNVDIILYFIGDRGEAETRGAEVVDFDGELDIALLKLDDPVTHVNKWIQVCSDEVLQVHNWETVGYPEYWNEIEEGTKHCYIKGNVHYIDNFEKKTVYDVHLSSELIKEDWAYTLGGLSGSPLIISGKIYGLIVREENSAIKSQLKAVSFNKCEAFLLRNQRGISCSFASSNLLVSGRLKTQMKNCNELFQKIDFTIPDNSIKVVLDPFILKYSEQGQSKINDLAKYLANSLNQYVCDLSELKELSTKPMKVNEIYQKTKRAIYEIQKQGKLGSIILWMLLEGVLGVPKFFKRFGMREESASFNEIYLGMRNSKLLFYLGEGKLSSDFKEGAKDFIRLLENCVDIKEDIFISDEDMYEDISPGYFKTLLDKFINNQTRDWDDVKLEMVIFTGYDSMQLRKIESENYSTNLEEVVKQVYIRESEYNYRFICDEMHSYRGISQVTIKWFILPFNNVSEFEKRVLKEFD